MNGSAPDQKAPLSTRRAELRDVRDIRAIDLAAFPKPWSEAMTISQVTETGRVHFVVEESQKVVGHGGLVFLADVAHVATIAVSQAFWGRGVGDLLMKQFFATAEANRQTTLTLEVREGNAAAIALYERHGLEVVGRRNGYYQDDGEDAIIMTRTAPSTGAKVT